MDARERSGHPAAGNRLALKRPGDRVKTLNEAFDYNDLPTC